MDYVYRSLSKPSFNALSCECFKCLTGSARGSFKDATTSGRQGKKVIWCVVHYTMDAKGILT